MGLHYLSLLFQSDPHLPLSFSLDAALRAHPLADGLARGAGLGGRRRPHLPPDNRFETKLLVSTELTPSGPRWIDQVEDAPVFGTLTAQSLSFILRLQWVLTPRLTLQAYAQQFSDLGRYDSFFQGVPGDDSRLRLSELVPVEYGALQASTAPR